ncbi:MAG: alpha/beta hydrolase family protein [Parachlamydiales bacterium]
MLSLHNDSLRLSAVLHLPSTRPCPAVLLAHGYGGNKIGYRRRYVHLARLLAERGIATLRLDQRGSGDSDGLFSEISIEGLVSDLLLGYGFLESHPSITTIGMLGSSFGAPLAIRTAAKAPVQSLALWAGLADGALWLSEWKGSQEALEDHFRCGEEGPPLQLLEEFKALRSDVEAASLGVPLFSAHGERDPVVAISHQEAYRRARPDGTFLKFPKSDHAFRDEGERAQLLEATASWFQKTLL